MNGHDTHSEHAEVHEAVVVAAHDHEEGVKGHEEGHHVAVHHEEGHQEEGHHEEGHHHEEAHHEEGHNHEETHHEEAEANQHEDRPLSDYDSVYVPPAAVAAEVAHEHRDYDNVEVRRDDVSSVGERRDSDAHSKVS